jgi:hypothetical protein
MLNIRAQRLASVQHNVRVSEQQHCEVPGQQLLAWERVPSPQPTIVTTCERYLITREV